MEALHIECSQKLSQVLLGDGPCLCPYNSTDMTRVPPTLPLSSAETHCSEQEASGQEEERVDMYISTYTLYMYTIFCTYVRTVKNMH